ncbi:hypothetical protein [Clostridium tagluense]|nr:hypothetical protein [Clostridium tagluense]
MRRIWWKSIPMLIVTNEMKFARGVVDRMTLLEDGYEGYSY